MPAHGAGDGTRRLAALFAERNSVLSRFRRDYLYPRITSLAPVSHVKNVKSQFGHIKHVSHPSTPIIEIRGRVQSVRMAGKKLAFVDLVEGEQRLQVVMNYTKLKSETSTKGTEINADQKADLNANKHDAAATAPVSISNTSADLTDCTHGINIDLLRRGDSISAVGQPWRTRAGELSLLCTHPIRLLAPNLRPLPEISASRTVLKHNRVAELKAFQSARDVLYARSTIIHSIGEFLRSKDFLMVQTPHLSQQRGGATARTFETQTLHGSKLHLRVAPELWLKRLVIGGFDRVFEIGNSYRNEAVDGTHNPEFTTCEFYMAYANLDDLVELTQGLLRHVASTVAETHPQFAQNCEVFSQEWQFIDFVPEMERFLGRSLPTDLHELQQICHSLNLPSDNDVAKCLDVLAQHFIEPLCTKPTFILRHPSVMAPLAKDAVYNNHTVSQRFELFVNGTEYVNAYEEENDPVLQLEKLRLQNPDVPDKAFVDSMEWGLPPTGGWGLGVDRLVMLLTGSKRICDVLSFGDMSQTNRM